MNEKNKEDHYLSLKDLISESLLRDLTLFTFLFLLIIAQAWDNIFLLLFPMVTFAFSLFFRFISTNKKRTEFQNSPIVYNPLGLERKHANRFFFSSLFQLILIFWLGAESLYNPHIVEGYYSYFTGIFIFSYTFGFFWIFIDIWKYTKIEIIKSAIEDRILQPNDSQFSDDISNLISFLKFRDYRIISTGTFVVFIILNILNIMSIIFVNINSSLGIPFNLPGTGSSGSEAIKLSFTFYLFLIISPILTTFLLIQNYKDINNFSREKLNKIIAPLPRNIQIKIIENFKTLNNKRKEQLKSE